ncbi:MAG TPA: hypothetical protein VFX30_11845 [bacterium]|nr:hypothetical protein [bacterium]
MAGLLFSGYLSYQELFGPASRMEGVSCGEAAFPIPGPPVCVYGFVMYAVILILSLLGLKGGREGPL